MVSNQCIYYFLQLPSTWSPPATRWTSTGFSAPSPRRRQPPTAPLSGWAPHRPASNRSPDIPTARRRPVYIRAPPNSRWPSHPPSSQTIRASSILAPRAAAETAASLALPVPAPFPVAVRRRRMVSCPCLGWPCPLSAGRDRRSAACSRIVHVRGQFRPSSSMCRRPSGRAGRVGGQAPTDTGWELLMSPPLYRTGPTDKAPPTSKKDKKNRVDYLKCNQPCYSLACGQLCII